MHVHEKYGPLKKVHENGYFQKMWIFSKIVGIFIKCEYFQKKWIFYKIVDILKNC